MNNKGFSLVELLVTFVVLGIIMIVVVQSYQNIIGNSNQTKYEYYLKSMKTSADLLLETRKNNMKSGECISISYQKLIDSGKLKEDNITCTGSLQLKKNGKKYTYDDTNLKCQNENGTVLKESTANVSSTCITY